MKADTWTRQTVCGECGMSTWLAREKRCALCGHEDRTWRVYFYWINEDRPFGVMITSLVLGNCPTRERAMDWAKNQTVIPPEGYNYVVGHYTEEVHDPQKAVQQVRNPQEVQDQD